MSTLSNPVSSNNESDFFKKKFAYFNSLERQLKDWQAINFVQLKIRTAKPAKLNKEEVSLEWRRSFPWSSPLVKWRRSFPSKIWNNSIWMCTLWQIEAFPSMELKIQGQILFLMQLGLGLVSLDANVFLHINVKKNHFELFNSC